MALKKKGSKKGGDQAAEASESPKKSPKQAPEAHLGEPKEIDAKLKERRKAKREKIKQETFANKSNPAPEVSAEDREKFKARAIELIKKGLKSDPEEQKKGFPFIPKEWGTEFKPVLGSYARFLEKCDDFVLIQGDVPGRFTVQLADGNIVAKPKSEWEVKLRNTWQVYLQCTKKDSRQPKEFVELAMRLASITVGDGGLASITEAKAEQPTAMQEKKRKKGAKLEATAAEAEEAEEVEAEKPKKKQKKMAA